jgi:Fis family transcriptional regulator
MKRENDISACIYSALKTYFDDLDGEMPAPIYDMVLRSVERPMLEVVMNHAKGNQTLASQMLGINRNTLRKKLVEYKLV